MTFLDQEIRFDNGHMILLLALIGFLLFLIYRRQKSSSESLAVSKGGESPAASAVQPIHWRSCRCPDCGEAALKQAREGWLYGCDPNNPYIPYSKEECNYQYRKAMLHGCGVAS